MTHHRRKHHDAALHADGMITKDALASSLIRLRQQAGLRQVDLVRLMGSTRSTISRLESPKGRLPDLHTLARYGKICAADVGLVFAAPTASGIRVHSALTLQSVGEQRLYERLFDEDLLLAAPGGQETP
jgi:transcriptional regulator with XRE-family HTH domain